MSTDTRRQKLIELVRTGNYSSQEELRKALVQHQFDVTQATLSRDLARLGIVRVPTSEGAFYRVVSRGESQDLHALIKYGVQDIRNNESVIFIRTLPGRAQGVAWFLDEQETELILGTVAGDDAVVVYPKSQAQMPDLIKYLHHLVDIPQFDEQGS